MKDLARVSAQIPEPGLATKLTLAAGRPDAAQVRHLTVSTEYAGQRIDNFLIRELKGVPKTHVYTSCAPAKCASTAVASRPKPSWQPEMKSGFRRYAWP